MFAFFIDFPHNPVDFRQIPTNVTKIKCRCSRIFTTLLFFDLRLPASILRDLCIDFVFFTHDVEVMRRSKGQVFFPFFWTDDMGINDQIYT